MRIAPAVAGLLCICATPAAFAQERTDEELLAIFARQVELFRAQAAGEEVATRGLKLVAGDTILELDGSPFAGQTGPSLMAGVGSEEVGTGLAATDGSVTVTAAPGGLAAPAGDGVDMAAATATAAPPVQAAPPQPVTVAQFSDELTIDVNIRFGYDSAALTPDQMPRLAQMCRVMLKSSVNMFEISGHTDAAGPEDYNSRLSLQRAQEVARYMVNDCGIDPARIRTVGKGEAVLKNPADPRGAENRRVEFQALS
ncbi:MAG: OmpA family protein [Rhodobacteraceae bacterium]|nr:OmpA family protein [Paracoccaceae bacterium]